MLQRRGFLAGLLAAPAIIRTPGLLMPVKPPREWMQLMGHLGGSAVYSRRLTEEEIRAEIAYFERRGTIDLRAPAILSDSPFAERFAGADLTPQGGLIFRLS